MSGSDRPALLLYLERNMSTILPMPIFILPKRENRPLNEVATEALNSSECIPAAINALELVMLNWLQSVLERKTNFVLDEQEARDVLEISRLKKFLIYWDKKNPVPDGSTQAQRDAHMRKTYAEFRYACLYSPWWLEADKN